MEIKLELLKSYISDFIKTNLDDFEINADEIANTVAINMLAEIQTIIKNDNYSDFEAIEKIVCVFEKTKYLLAYATIFKFYIKKNSGHMP